MHPLIEAHRQEIIEIAERRGFSNVRVFGSMARGDATQDSDVDLLVTTKPKTTLVGLSGLVLDVEELLNRKVDVVTDDEIYHLLRDRILGEAVPL